MYRPTLQPQANRLAAWKAKFLVSLGRGEGAERRSSSLCWQARRNLRQAMAAAALTPIYLWIGNHSARVAALCLNSAGKLFAMELNRARPLTLSQAWAFVLACREWADTREIEDRDAVCRWEEAILRQLQVADSATSRPAAARRRRGGEDSPTR